MIQLLLTAFGAGATAALLFASLASGSVFAVFLCFLAPLPLMIAAVGWSHWTGLLAALLGTAMIGIGLGFFSGLAFFSGVALPAWWLGYLTLLARPGATGSTGQVEWYPVGSLVFWAAIASLLIAAVTYFVIDFNQDRLRTALRPLFEQLVGRSSGNGADVDRIVTTFLALAPSVAAIMATITNLVSLWLAGHAVRISGRLPRPWPDIAALRLPRHTFPLLLAALAGWFLPTGIGVLSGSLAVSLLVAYAVVGFAFMHSITRGFSSRSFVIGVVYAAVLVLGWPMLVMTALGLADSALDLRGRWTIRGGPPAAGRQ